ncbi:MAG: FCD domain-containing protein [Rhodospirillales bacterium]|nr:MAG: FCD domain-containing protein [Rhodospirillales bacterium]
MQFPKIRQERLSDAIARTLERMIVEGAFAAGERLPSERDLAIRLDVSRPSLREALHKLEVRGLLETRHGGGTYVRNTLAQQLTDPLADLFQRHPQAGVDFIELRKTLDGMAAYYAALRGSEADRAAISATFDAIVAAHGLDDPTVEAERDAEFHIAIAEASHNLVLLHVVRGLMDLLRKDVLFNRDILYAHPHARDRLLEQHRAVHDAIIAGDAEAARQAAQAHMAHVEDVMRERRIGSAPAAVA